MKKLFILTFVFVLFAGALPVMAQTVCSGGECRYTPLEPLPCPPGTPDCQSGTVNFPNFLSNLFRLLISVGGLFAVVMLVVAGIGYMISEAAGDIDKAKSRAKAALWGLLLLTSCWLILNTINPDLLKFDLTSLGKFGKTTPGSTSAGQPIKLDEKTLQELQRTSNGDSITVDNSNMDSANAKEATFRSTCEGKGGKSVATISDGMNSSTFTCQIPQYLP